MEYGLTHVEVVALAMKNWIWNLVKCADTLGNRRPRQSLIAEFFEALP